MDFWSFRDNIATDLQSGACPKSAEGMVAHAVKFGRLNVAVAAEYVERFFGMVNRDIEYTTKTKVK